jgi:hypothetical protein
MKVIVMHTEHAAYGIDLTSAQRIYFMDPVSDPSKELQAIKRSHRIGQRNEVSVEILVIAGTVEEDVLQQRHQDKVTNGTEVHHQKALLKGLLKSASYIEPPEQDSRAENTEMPAWDLNISPLKKGAFSHNFDPGAIFNPGGHSVRNSNNNKGKGKARVLIDEEEEEEEDRGGDEDNAENEHFHPEDHWERRDDFLPLPSTPSESELENSGYSNGEASQQSKRVRFS